MFFWLSILHSLLPADKMMGCQPVKSSLEARARSKNFHFFRSNSWFCICRYTVPYVRENVTWGRCVRSDFLSPQRYISAPFPNSSQSSFSPNVFFFFNFLIFHFGSEVSPPQISSQRWVCSTPPQRSGFFFLPAKSCGHLCVLGPSSLTSETWGETLSPQKLRPNGMKDNQFFSLLWFSLCCDAQRPEDVPPRLPLASQSLSLMFEHPSMPGGFLPQQSWEKNLPRF